MAKVVKNVTLDYEVVEEFRMSCNNEKLSTVLNDLLKTYTNVHQKKLSPKKELENKRKSLLKTKSKLDSEILHVKSQLAKHDKLDEKLNAKKETEFKKLGEVLFNNNREQFDKWWDEKNGNQILN